MRSYNFSVNAESLEEAVDEVQKYPFFYYVNTEQETDENIDYVNIADSDVTRGTTVRDDAEEDSIYSELAREAEEDLRLYEELNREAEENRLPTLADEFANRGMQ